MRALHPREVAAIALIAGAVAGCGGDNGATARADKGKLLRGETETGMELQVETFLDPARDPQLEALDAYRAKEHYRPVDYHRVTADNTKGRLPDRDRTVTFAKSADAIAAGQGVDPRFACDVLRYEWLPAGGAGAETAAQADLKRRLCRVAPETPDSIAPGRRQVYYLITDRGFSERGIERLRVFGPRAAELR